MLGAMPFARRPVRLAALVALTGTVAVTSSSCERRRGCAGDYCGTLVFATAGEPDILLPPVTQQQYAQDIFEQVFLKLAELGLSQNTIGDEDFQPQLAQRWEWDDPLTLVFHLDPRAHWQDGRPVTAADVAFTFDIYTDPLVNSAFRSSLRTISAVTTRDSLTAVFRCHARSGAARRWGARRSATDRIASWRGRRARASSSPRIRPSSWDAPTSAV